MILVIWLCNAGDRGSIRNSSEGGLTTGPLIKRPRMPISKNSDIHTRLKNSILGELSIKLGKRNTATPII